MEAGTEYFLPELQRASGALEGRTTAFLFGGGVLAIRLLKARTKDLDLVVRGRASSGRLIKAFERTGYHRRRRLAGAYRRMNASAVLDNPAGFRIDLFTDVICRALDFGPSMQARSEPFDIGAGDLELRLAALEDLFVLKAVTDRPRDVADMALLARQGLDWDAIEREMLGQRRTGGKFFMPIFVQSLEELVNDHKVPVPILPAMLAELEKHLDEIEAMNKAGKAAREAHVRKHGPSARGAIKPSGRGRG